MADFCGRRGGLSRQMFDVGRVSVTFVAGTLALGGAERQLFYLVRALHEAGANVRVLSLTKGEFWEEPLRDAGASVTWVGQPHSRAARLWRIVARLRRDRPALVQSHHFFTNLYAVAAARLLGLREVGAIRNDACSEVQFTGRLGLLSLRAPRLLAANSRAGIDNAIALGVSPQRIQMLPNVVDTEQFAPSHSRSNGDIRLLTVGMRAEKRIDRFLHVVSTLQRRSRTPVKAVVVGDGPERGRYEQLAADLGLLPDVVEFRGAVAMSAQEYRAADIFVLTSDFEGTPNVILEAMASGLPVVACRTGGVAEIVRHGETGYIAERGDEASAVEHLQTLIESSMLRARMGQAARQYVQDNYALSRLPKVLSEFYENALT